VKNALLAESPIIPVPQKKILGPPLPQSDLSMVARKPFFLNPVEQIGGSVLRT